MTDGQDGIFEASSVAEDEPANVKPEPESAEEKDASEKSLAEKLELTLRGFLDFVLAYSKTLLMAVSLRGILTYDAKRFTKGSKLVRPLTFLCCSYLPCAVILEVSASSFWEVLVTPEVAVSKLLSRLQDISPAKILLNSIPVLISIYLCSYLLSRWIGRDRGDRENFLYGMCYAFGVQFASTALLLGLFLLSHSRISEQIIPRFALEGLSPLIQGYTVIALTLAATAFPLLVAALIARRAKSRWRVLHIGRVLVAVTAIMFFAYWLGSLPARFQQAVHPAATLSAEIYGGDLTTVDPDFRSLHAEVVIRNPTSKALMIDRASGIRINFRVGDHGQTFPAGALRLKIKENPDGTALLAVKPGEVISVTGDFSPDYEDWQILERTLPTTGLLYSRLEVANEEGTTTDEEWVALGIRGSLPSLTSTPK